MEEGVAGEDVLSVRHQPVVELTLLLGQRVQLVPDVGAATRGAQPGETQGGAVLVGDGLEVVELADVLPGADHGDLGVGEAGVAEVPQREQSGVVRTRSADPVVDLRRRAVQGDLYVDIVGRGQERGPLGSDPEAVGGELHADLVVDGVLHELPEVGADRRLPAADVHVEDLHALQLVDDGLALLGAELARVAPARARQAMGTFEVAGVGQLPGQADRGVEAELELLDEAAAFGTALGSAGAFWCDGHTASWWRGRIMSVSARARSAAAYASCCSGGMPAASSALPRRG